MSNHVSMEAPLAERPEIHRDGRTVPSDERAMCWLCGINGWRGDWPGQGGIVGHPDVCGELVCDDCAEDLDRDEEAE